MMNLTTTRTDKISYSVEELAEAMGLSDSYLRKEIYAGNLRSKKVGRRVLILRKDAESFLEQFESAESTDSNK